MEEQKISHNKVPTNKSLEEGSFTKFVRGEDDLVGYVAYSLYKEHKIRWLESVEGWDESDHVQQEEVDKYFYSLHLKDESIANFRLQAEQQLEETFEILLENTIPEKIAELFDKLKEDAKVEARLEIVRETIENTLREQVPAQVDASIKKTYRSGRTKWVENIQIALVITVAGTALIPTVKYLWGLVSSYF